MFTLYRSSPIAAAFLTTSTTLVPLSNHIMATSCGIVNSKPPVLSAQNALPHHVPDPPLWDSLEHAWQSKILRRPIHPMHYTIRPLCALVFRHESTVQL